MPSGGAPQDPVTRVLDEAVALVRGRPSDDSVEALLAALDDLQGREVVRFDERSRSWSSGVGPAEIADLRRWWRRGASHRLWTVMALVSADGFERQGAIEEVELRRSTVSLIALRSTEWVEEVREAARRRLTDAPESVLLDLMPLLEVLTQERWRADGLDALVEERLSDGDLRAATHSDDVLTRRGGWRRLIARGAHATEDLTERAARDPDPMVRGLAARQMRELDGPNRRAIADILVRDPIGWLAGLGLEALVELEGPRAIRSALTAPNATLRRRAREWAAIRDVDARSVYVERLRAAPSDALALVGLAEVGDRADRDVLVHALGDSRSGVRAAVLKAVARFDMAAAKSAAMDELAAGRSGPVGRAAAGVLSGVALGEADLNRLEEIAVDDRRPAGQRRRALALLRPARWRHLAVVMEARPGADLSLLHALDQELRVWINTSGHVSRGPDAGLRSRLHALLPTLDSAYRREIDFVLRTST